MSRRPWIGVPLLLASLAAASSRAAAQRKDVYMPYNGVPDHTIFGAQLSTSEYEHSYSTAVGGLGEFTCGMTWSVYKQGNVYTYFYQTRSDRGIGGLMIWWPMTELSGTGLHYGVLEYDSGMRQGEGAQVKSQAGSHVTFTANGRGQVAVYLQSLYPPKLGDMVCASMEGMEVRPAVMVPDVPAPFTVTGASLSPVKYIGPCPANVTFRGTVNTNKPGSIATQFIFDDGLISPTTVLQVPSTHVSVSFTRRFTASRGGTYSLSWELDKKTSAAYSVTCLQSVPNVARPTPRSAPAKATRPSVPGRDSSFTRTSPR